MAQTGFHSENAATVTTVDYNAYSINSVDSPFKSATNTSNTAMYNLTDSNSQLNNQMYVKEVEINSLQTQIDQIYQQMKNITMAT